MKEMSREEALARIEFRVRCACPQANGDHIGECNGCWRYPCNDMKAVNLLAQERPRGEWIPCSERLPKRNELVIASFATGVQLCEYVEDRTSDEWFSLIDDCYVSNKLVKAWMPLPEPYKEGGDSDA